MNDSKWQVNPGIEAALKLSFPLREQGLQQRSFSLRHDPELAYWIGIVLTQDFQQLETIPAAIFTTLREMGVIIETEQAAKKIYWQAPDLLKQSAPSLLPYSGRLARLANLPPATELKINPTCLFQSAGAPLPAEIAGRLSHTHKIAPDQSRIWLEKSGSRFLSAYHVDLEDRGLMSILHGQRTLSQLNTDLLLALYQREILIDRSGIQQQKSEWKRQLSQAQNQMKATGYSVLSKLIPAFQLAAFRCYFRQLEAEGYFQKGDAQVKDRHSIYNDAMCRYLHTQLTPIVNTLTPKPVKPSYAMLSTYQPGAVLRKHKDRQQCEWNLSLVLDMNPEQEQDQAWPIYIDQADQPHAIPLEIGDGVLYRGYSVDHWRDALAAGQQVTVAFFHFVTLDFEGSLA